ncbi:AraC-type DNA-binding protein [Clostridium cavendishii DSM 21758]|uniref:AraC-type DNA-binding protein n=1 Tax=Clostridium cavendishii DSM 21758 TaxID=1121302 RepID=A0A1M6KT52_9CLOT|nr:AraC family transcriptional regulator [Clostridium cavendishii]SHJ62195.1 AraC-type DNA-binding protein [Clostridium cavendishii DSM 21758]
MNTEKNTLRETVSRENSPIPFYVYKQNWINCNLYLHWHNEVEFIYVEKGKIIFNINTVPIKVSEGEAIIINSGSLHSANCVKDVPSIHHAILFDLNILNSSYDDYYQTKYIKPLLDGELKFPLIIDKENPWGKSIISELKEIINIHDNKLIAWELDLKISIYKILSIFIKENNLAFKDGLDSSKLGNKIDIIKKILNYIHKNYMSKIYIEDLAKEVNMNPQYFCRFFKNNISKTPVEYINEYRINKAVKIIQTEDKRILDICFEVGFDNFSYFIKKFKEYKGVTPNKYKKLV